MYVCMYVCIGRTLSIKANLVSGMHAFHLGISTSTVSATVVVVSVSIVFLG